MNNSISIVVATRNDNHGGNLIKRTNSFLNGLAYKLDKHNFKVELVIVEWNKIPEKLSIKELLDFSSLKKFADIKVISVSQDQHLKILNSEKINFFQMIAKNVGIRNSTGDFIIATNIDIIFNDKIFNFIKNHKLEENTIYRVDRHDLSIVYTDQFEDQLLDEKVSIINKINYTYDLKSNRKYYVNSSLLKYFYLTKYSIEDYGIFFTIKKIIKYLKKNKIKLNSNNLKYIKYKFLPKLYTNACGDFTMISRNSWFKLNGYSELPYFSWHLDSLLLWFAFFKKFKFINLNKNFYTYHMAHQSGGSLNDLKSMYKNLEKKEIPYIENSKFINYLELIEKKKYSEIGSKSEFGLIDEKLEYYKIK